MIPISIKQEIMQVVIDQGYKIYLVGGWVKRALENKTENYYDLDFATDMPWDKVYALFIRMPSLQKFPQYLSVHFKFDLYNIEITQFRKEISYDAHRYPQVEPVSSLEEDAKRRDFTVNALYLDINEKVYDFYQGQKALKYRTLKVIGDPQRKMQADHLRTLRALRLMAQDDYSFDSKLDEALILKPKLSFSQMKSEVIKLLEGAHLVKVFIFYKEILDELFAVDVSFDLFKLDANASYRLLVIYKDDQEKLKHVLRAWSLAQKDITYLLRLHDALFKEKLDYQQVFIENTTLFYDLITLKRRLVSDDQELKEIYCKMDKTKVRHVSDLKIKGHDLIKEAIPAPMRALVLKLVLWDVLMGHTDATYKGQVACLRRIKNELY